jgi:DNA-binding NarL/FixJ family response regulator
MSFSLRIAIADNDPGTLASLTKMVGNLGHEVVAVAENGESLVNKCAATEPDVVITGLLNPEMNGRDAAAAVYQGRPIPILLFSHHCEPDSVLDAEHKHVFMYLMKPLCQEYLQMALTECRHWGSAEPIQDEENYLTNSPASRISGARMYREHSRPPYHQWSRYHRAPRMA